MWQLSVSWWEIILRVAIIYVFLLVILRLSGKRQVGQLAPFDLVLLLVLSNAVQNAMNGGDNSVLAGLISAGALVLVNYLVVKPGRKYEESVKLFEPYDKVEVRMKILRWSLLACSLL